MVTSDRVWRALRSVNDPEYPLSLVDLGMIYDVRVEGAAVSVTMTFTSIGCPAIDMIMGDIEAAVRDIPGVETVQVDVVWSPPWTRDRITADGRRVLAAHGVVN